MDLSKTYSRQTVPAGTVIVLQGSSVKGLPILHSGLAELLSYNGEAALTDPEQIIAGSIRVGLIRGESVCAIMGLQNPIPYERSIRTITDCLLSSMPVDPDKLLAMLQSDITLNLQVLRAMVQRIESAVFLFNNYSYLWHKLASIQDSLAISAAEPSSLKGAGRDDRYGSSFADYAAFIHRKIAALENVIKTRWDYNVFLGKIQEQLGLYDEHDSVKVENLVDYQQFLFIKRLLRKPDQLLASIFHRDEPTNYYFFQFLGRTLEELLKQNESAVQTISALIKILFSDNGWIADILRLQNKKNNSIKMFNYYLGKFAWRCKNDIMKLIGKDLVAEYPVYGKLGEFEPEFEPEDGMQPSDGRTARPLETSGANLDKYRNLLTAILEFSDLAQEKKKELVTLLQVFRDSPKKFELEPRLNKAKTDFTKLYWELYENCFLKIIDTDLKGFIPGIMLHFGLLDERMLTRDELAALDTLYARSLAVERPVSVMTLPHFLEKIYKAECRPSITEMGETFIEVINKQKKLTKKEAGQTFIFENTAEDRVRYEIRRIASDNLKLLYGSRKKAFPVLCSEAVHGEIGTLALDPEKAAAMIDAVRERDFTLFYRETVLHHKFGSDIIRKEVVPDFVLYPGAGSRMLMWQELDGARRDTPGRIFLPIIFNEKAGDTLLVTLAHFRWELQKTIAGARWMDAVDGGLVGSYYDYITFFRKNVNLTTETKEYLAEFVKKTRSDRERFAFDYMAWVKHEYEGHMKLNPVVREIFYRYCPFKKEVRNGMSQKSAFGNLETKYQNRVNAEILKIESRRRKFEKAEVKVPGDIVKYLACLQS